MNIFTETELKKLTRSQLITLCDYYKIRTYPEWKKTKIIKEILKKETEMRSSSSEPSYPAQPPAGASVRIKRIQDAMKGN